MNITQRGRVLATTTSTLSAAAAAIAWHRGRGVLASVLSVLIGGVAGLVAGQVLANANDLPAGLVTAGPDGDSPERQVDGSEIDGYVDESQRPFYDVLSTAAVAGQDKFQPISFVRTTPAPLV